MLHILDIIRKKRDGGTLTKDEIEYFVRGCTDGSIPDYQLSRYISSVARIAADKGDTYLLYFLKAATKSCCGISLG